MTFLNTARMSFLLSHFRPKTCDELFGLVSFSLTLFIVLLFSLLQISGKLLII